MVRRVWRDRSGLTLVELLIALAVLGVMLGAMFGATKAMVHAWATGQHRIGVQQNGRNAIEWVTRRIRAAGLGVDVQQQPIFTGAASDTIRFRANSSTTEYEYTTDHGRLLESVYDRGSLSSSRFLTVDEEVGVITVTDMNFCYYGWDNTLLNPPQDPVTGRCSGRADPTSVYRVQMRLTIVSGRPGEEPITLYSQAFVRPQEMP